VFRTFCAALVEPRIAAIGRSEERRSPVVFILGGLPTVVTAALRAPSLHSARVRAMGRKREHPDLALGALFRRDRGRQGSNRRDGWPPRQAGHPHSNPDLEARGRLARNPMETRALRASEPSLPRCQVPWTNGIELLSGRRRACSQRRGSGSAARMGRSAPGDRHGVRGVSTKCPGRFGSSTRTWRTGCWPQV
jgi:hypothetical protein